MPSDAAGFVVDEAEVVFWGLCRDCQADGRVADPAGALQISAQETRGGVHA
jgi:Fur family ferric uptake transcriptional regulator